ncbi:MAG: helix-turn-helix transcriptional regulator [Opitutales bacterium]|nr:helix-turn-helix transcriptional regulator [Opitutales bacterium]
MKRIAFLLQKRKVKIKILHKRIDKAVLVMVTLTCVNARKGERNMFNKEAFIEKVKEKGLTLDALAVELGINYSTLYRKMNGDSDFTRAEIQKAKAVLNLDVNTADAIFFGL